ncbi:4304_t:CDS:1, partial [Funneliformis geosporum]
GFSTSAPKSNCLLDDHTGAHQEVPKLPDNNQRFLENEPAEDNQYSIRSIDHRSRGIVQESNDQITTGEREDRSIFIPSRSEWERYFKQRIMGVRELRRGKSVDLPISVEVRSSDQNLHNECTVKSSDTTMQELPELSDISEIVNQLRNKPYGFHETTDEELLDSDLREYFCETFGITGVRP